MPEIKRKIVLGLGNTLNKDEGLGVHLLHALRNRLGEPENFELVDGGVLGLNLLPLVEQCSHLLILDAVNVSKQPGTIVELSGDDIPLYSDVKMSQHQITFQEVLGLASIRGKLPEHMHLLGAQPADISVGADITLEIESIMPELIKRAKRVLTAWALL